MRSVDGVVIVLVRCWSLLNKCCGAVVVWGSVECCGMLSLFVNGLLLGCTVAAVV